MISDIEDKGSAPEPKIAWNTEAPAIKGMTCGEAARFMSAFISSFRMLSAADQQDGRRETLDQLLGMLLLHRQAAYEKPLEGMTKELADRDTEIGLAAMGLASIYATTNMEVSQLLQLSVTAMGIASGILDKVPPESQNVNLRFVVRPSGQEHQLEFGAFIQSDEEVKASQDKSGITKLVEEIKEEQKPEDN